MELPDRGAAPPFFDDTNDEERHPRQQPVRFGREQGTAIFKVVGVGVGVVVGAGTSRTGAGTGRARIAGVGGGAASFAGCWQAGQQQGGPSSRVPPGLLDVVRAPAGLGIVRLLLPRLQGPAAGECGTFASFFAFVCEVVFCGLSRFTRNVTIDRRPPTRRKRHHSYVRSFPFVAGGGFRPGSRRAAPRRRPGGCTSSTGGSWRP